jgi:CDP-4-dehydro-6-deoxyglucose reductase
MALLPWQQATVIRIENESPDTRRFWIRMDELSVFDFKPGQFVTLDLPIHEKPNKRMRSYSIASAPDGTNVFELVIVLDKNGAGTNYLFQEVTVGSKLTVRGPLGVFALKQPLDGDTFFICTGTGIAPFRSMILDIYNNKISHGNIYLLFGCRTKQDLLYYNEFRELEKNPLFHYLPVLSRETWDGHSGYVHAVYEKICENRQPASFYLCGWRGMINEARERIEKMGYDRKALHFELFG